MAVITRNLVDVLIFKNIKQRLIENFIRRMSTVEKNVLDTKSV
jgi:hypothetical protein